MPLNPDMSAPVASMSSCVNPVTGSVNSTVNGIEVLLVVGDSVVSSVVEGRVISVIIEIKVDSVLPLPAVSVAAFAGICTVMVPSEVGSALKL